MRLRLLILISCLLSSVGVWAHYARLESRAERFVQFQEWGSANAMYMLMIDRCPAEPSPYSRAIVTSGLLSDSSTQAALLEMTQKQGIPLDSIFYEVNKFAYEIGESQEYEEFLLLVKEKQPWMSRNINMRLLNFYDFRNDATNMVKVAEELLVATPHEVKYLLAVARGQMMLSLYENAVDSYEKVLEIDAENIDALLALGNYYYVVWKDAEGTRSQFTSTRNKAIEYLQKAYTLQPTPFVAKILTELRI